MPNDNFDQELPDKQDELDIEDADYLTLEEVRRRMAETRESFYARMDEILSSGHPLRPLNAITKH